MHTQIDLRQADANDREFLFSVFAADKRLQLAAIGWDAAAQDAFLSMQFEMRERAYRSQYPNAALYVVEYSSEKAGTIWLDTTGSTTHILDIAVAYEYRRKGIAATVLRDLQDKAAMAGHSIDLTVDNENAAAQALYLSLGFIKTGADQLQKSMCWAGENSR